MVSAPEPGDEVNTVSDTMAKRRDPARRLHIERKLQALARERAELRAELAALEEAARTEERTPFDPMPTAEDRELSRWP